MGLVSLECLIYMKGLSLCQMFPSDIPLHAKTSKDSAAVDDGNARYGSPSVRKCGAGPATES
jgi:hypothetical protein